jgi:hypothetical protein
VIWAILAALFGLLLFYAVIGRAWLKRQEWTQGFFAFVEPIERRLFLKSETILAGRLLWLVSGIVTAYDFVALFASQLDWTPVTSRLLAGVPEDMRPLIVSAAISLIGLLINWLRKRTTKPLEVVAAPDKPPPTVASAVQRVEMANANAVAAIESAKAKGQV